MMQQQQGKLANKRSIALAGSTKVVSEFFEYAVNSILFQRGIYPPEDFRMVKKYGLNMLVTSDENLEKYIKNIIKQLNAWLLKRKVDRVVLVLLSKETKEALERWQFDINLDEPAGQDKENSDPEAAAKTTKVKEKTIEQIQSEIQAIIRHITASNTFLPLLEEKCVFNILIYTDKDTAVPAEWQDSDAHLISGSAEQVKLRSFSTNVHRVEAMVAYRLGEE